MSESGPSRPPGRGGGNTTQKNKYYKRGGFGGQRGGAGRGGSRGDGRGRGGGGGRVRGRGGPPGGSNGQEENGERHGGAGPSWEGGEKKHHLGRYRDDPLSEIMMAPGICATAIQNKERSAERELIDYLERIADELYPDTADDIVKAEPDGDAGADFEEMLKKELEGMSVDRKSSRFRLCKHDTPCVIYVNVLPPLDPTRLIVHMLEQIEATGRCPFKFLKRIIPLTGTTNATLTALTSLCPSVLSEGFRSDSNTPLTFGIITNSRNSDRLDRMDMIKAVAEQVSVLNPAHKVDLKSPDRTVLIEVNKNRLGISVVQHYERFRKYNAYQLAESAAQARAKSPEPAPEAQASTTPAAPIPSRGSLKHAKRDQKAAQMASAVNPNKRKLADLSVEQEDGEVVRSADELERGEIVHGDEAEKLAGDDFEEIIEGGRVVKMRKEE